MPRDWLKKSVRWAPYAVFLLAFFAGTAGFAAWVYLNRNCEDCQFLPAIRKEVRTLVKHGQFFDTRSERLARGDERMDPPVDPHGDSINETKLPVLELLISQKNEDKLKEARPDWNGKSQSLPDVHWPSVKAQLKYEGRVWPVKVKYRGWAWDHYRMPDKKSWRIEFPKQNLFFGLDSINIINQRPLTTIHDVFQYEIMKRQGFLLAEQKLVHFRINGKYIGVQTFLEQPSNHLIARRNLPEGDQIFGDVSVMGNEASRNDLKFWQIYSGDKSNWEPLKRLLAALKTKGTPEFKKNINAILDVEQYLTFLADAAITIKYNPSSHNIRWLYDIKKGKFQIIPWYQSTEGYILSPDPDFMKNAGYLTSDRVTRPLYLVMNDEADALLREPEYLEAFQHRVWEMLNTSYHFQPLLDLHQQMFNTDKPDLMADAHQHALGQHHYVSHKERLEKMGGVENMMAVHDKNIRTTLAESHLDWTWNKAARPNDGHEQALGTLRFETASLSSPVIRKVCLALAQPLPAGSSLMLQAPSGARAAAKAQGDHACFELNDKLKAGQESYIDEDLSKKIFAPGVLILGVPFERAVLIRGTPKRYDYTLLYTAGHAHATLPAVASVSVKAINNITGEPLDKPVAKVVAETLLKPPPREYYYHFSPAIDSHSAFEPSFGLTKWVTKWDVPPKTRDVVWTKGAPVTIAEDTTLGEDVRLVIKPGTTVRIAPGKYLAVHGSVVAEGTQENPIIFTSTGKEPFGSIIITNTKDRENVLRHVTISNGSSAKILDVAYSGALSIYAADALLDHVTLENNAGPDALSGVYTNSKIVDSIFKNDLDCIDLDFSDGEIRNSSFDGCTDDGIDLSYSNTVIDGNTIRHAADKGISIGEKSKPVISHNTIDGADTGIAVHDLSSARIAGNTVSHTDTGISLYIKRPEFGPSEAELGDNLFTQNKQDISAEGGKIVRVSSP